MGGFMQPPAAALPRTAPPGALGPLAPSRERGPQRSEERKRGFRASKSRKKKTRATRDVGRHLCASASSNAAVLRGSP